jgi:hypothetical protein
MESAGVQCIGNIEASKYSSMMENYSDIACHGKTCCAFSTMDQLSCFTSGSILPDWATSSTISDFFGSLQPPPTMIESFSMADNHACIGSSFMGSCWGEANHCTGNTDCAGASCSSAEVPCNGSFLGGLNDTHEVQLIKTSTTNTCGLIDNLEGSDGAFLKCTGQTGWGLGGENEITNATDVMVFPFLNSSNMQNGYTFNDVNYEIDNITKVAMDEKRICVEGSFKPSGASDGSTFNTRMVCAGKTALNGTLKSTMLTDDYSEFDVRGTWICGIEFNDGVFCTDIEDLDNIDSATQMFPNVATSMQRLSMSENSVCAMDEDRNVFCTALPGMAAQNFHIQTLGL